MTYTTSTPIKGSSLGDPAKIAAWAKAKGCARPDDVADYLDTLGGISQCPPLTFQDAVDLRLANAKLAGNCVLAHASQCEQANLRNVLPVQLRARLPARVLGKRQWAHVVGVHTRRIATCVVRNHTFREWAESLFVVPAMGGSLLAVSPQSPVSVLVDGELPNPTPRLFVNDVLGRWVRARTHVVTETETKRLALDMTMLGPVVLGNRRALPTPAFTVTVRNIWGRIGVHSECLLTGFRGAMPRTVTAVPGSLRASIIPQFPRTYAGLGV